MKPPEAGTGLVEHWSPVRRWECLSTDDELSWSEEDDVFLSRVGGGVRKSQASGASGGFRVTGRIDVPDDPVTALCVSGRTPFTAHKSGLVRKWAPEPNPDSDMVEDGCFKAGHRGPLTLMEATSPDSLNPGTLFTSGPDLALKVWEMAATDGQGAFNPVVRLRGVFKGIRSVPLCLTVSSNNINSKNRQEGDPPGEKVLIACGQADGSVGLWGFCRTSSSLEKRNRITATVHNSQISCLTFTGSSRDRPQQQQLRPMLVTCGRDRVMVWWDVEDGSCLRVVPVAETVEKLVPLPVAGGGMFERWLPVEKRSDQAGSGRLLLSGGDKGQLRVWDSIDGKEVPCPGLQSLCRAHCDSTEAIKDLHISRKSHASDDDERQQQQGGCGISLHYLHGDVMVSLSGGGPPAGDPADKVHVSMTSTGQHEVVDLALVSSSRKFLAVASSSNALRVYDFRRDPPLLSHVAHGAHSDSVLSLATVEDGGGDVEVPQSCAEFFMSTGKDQSVVLWRLSPIGGNGSQSDPNDGRRYSLAAVARGQGHTSFVGASAITRTALFSASKDGLLKVWKWPRVEPNRDEEQQQQQQELESRRTIAAHGLEINTLSAVELGRLGDKDDGANALVASGSQDKTVKVWRGSDLALVANLTGHRRGVWKCRFFHWDNGPSRRLMLASASADCTVKLWDVATGFSCLHTMEGHQSSVLGLTALGNGAAGPSHHHQQTRLATVGSDGLLKVWSSGNGWTTAVGSFDAHDDKIWAVASASIPTAAASGPAEAGPEEAVLITAGRDGEMVLWKDETKQHLAQKRAEEEELVRTDQRLNNLLAGGELAKALKLSLRLDRPRLVKQTLEALRRRGRGDLESALHKLNARERGLLTKHLVQWNSFGSLSALVQDSLQVLLMDGLASSTTSAVSQVVSASQCVGLMSYSEKHYKRLDKLHSRLAVVDLLLSNM